MFKRKKELELERLYSNDIKIKLDILNLLYRDIEGFTVEIMATKISSTPKTIYKYIKDINSLSIDYYGDISIKIKSNDNRYCFQDNKIRFLTLRFLIIEKCESLQLLLALLPKSSVNKYEFCSRYYLSESTLKNYIRNINSLLRPLSLNLITKKNEIYLIGDEMIARYFFSSIIWRTYNGLKWPYDDLISTEKLLELKKKLYKNSKISISLGRQVTFVTQIGVNILRVNSLHVLSAEQLPIYTKELTGTLTNLETFKTSLKNNFYLNDAEIDFIFLNLFLSPTHDRIVNHNQITLNILKEKSPTAFNSCTQFIDIIKKKHPTLDPSSIKCQNFISAVLSAHILIDIYKQACFNIQELNLNKFALTEFPMLIPSIQNIAQTLNPNLPEDLLKALTFHLTKAYLLSFSPRDFEPEINTLLVTDSPSFVERGTIFQIKSTLRYKFNLNISSIPSKHKYIDLIISTGSYPDIPQNIPIIYVFPQITTLDVKNINEACDKIYEDKLVNYSYPFKDII